MKKLLFAASTLLIAGSAFAGDDKDLAGTEGTSTSWEDSEVLLVEVCDKDENGDWDYPTCVRVLRSKTATKLCQRGEGSYKWSFQVGAEKSKLDQTTTCKSE